MDVSIESNKIKLIAHKNKIKQAINIPLLIFLSSLIVDDNNTSFSECRDDG